jgi:LacI family transcriptional regulator
MIKLKDVAILAGVSEATASLVMNNRPGVNKQTRERVIEASIQLGYTPNFIARGLAMQKSHTIGLVVTDAENPFFGSLTRYIDEFVLSQECNLILSVSNDNLDLEERIINDFIGKRVDGVILVPTVSQRHDLSSFEQLEKHHIPFVFCTAFYPGVDCECVMTDLEEGSYQLTNYLIEIGHRDIVFLVTSDRKVVASKQRIEGYKKALLENRVDFSEENIISCGHPDFNCGYELTKKLISEKKPDAIIAINDILALGVKRAVKEKGYAVPDEISIAGYDDVIFSSISEIPLTTVKQDIQEISRVTVDILFKKIKNIQPKEKLIKIRPELVVRKSTGIKIDKVETG